MILTKIRFLKVASRLLAGKKWYFFSVSVVSKVSAFSAIVKERWGMISQKNKGPEIPAEDALFLSNHEPDIEEWLDYFCTVMWLFVRNISIDTEWISG